MRGSARRPVRDPLAALEALRTVEGDAPALLILPHFHRFLGSVEVMEAVRDAVRDGKQRRRYVLVLSPVVEPPRELEHAFVVLEHPLPDREQLLEIAASIVTGSDELPDGAARDRMLDAAAGLTRYEAEGAFALSIIRDQAIQPETILANQGTDAASRRAGRIWRRRWHASACLFLFLDQSPWRTSMATILDDPRRMTVDGERLQQATAAARVSIHWFGTRKSLTREQKTQAAETFDAEGAYLSAGKRLLDTKHPAWQGVTAVRGRILGYWRGVSLPFPEAGARLIRRDQVEPFDRRMAELRDELDRAVRALDGHIDVLRHTARDRLGRLFDPCDYPTSLDGHFGVTWDFPAIEPPSYLMRLAPALYEEQSQRIRRQFDEAVALAEEAFCEELGKLVTHLTERLRGEADGKPKIFRDSAVENLHAFFDRFRTLQIGSSGELETLVAQAQRVVRGVTPDGLRSSTTLRDRVAEELSAVRSSLDAMMIDRPRRHLIRRPR